MSLKLTEELRVMTMKNDAKFEEELTCRVLELICAFRNSMKMQMQCEKFILLWT